jgi:DNA polymerase-1
MPVARCDNVGAGLLHPGVGPRCEDGPVNTDEPHDDLVALVVGWSGSSPTVAALAGPAALLGSSTWAGAVDDAMARAASIERSYRPRWVVWSCGAALAPLVAAGMPIARCWDLAEVHRLLVGGWVADPGVVWATARGLDPDSAPRPHRQRGAEADLFSTMPSDDPFGDRPLDERGFIPAAALDPAWVDRPARAAALAQMALTAQEGQRRLLVPSGSLGLHTAYAESAAAVLCLEMARDGLPVDRPEMERLVESAAGPRPASEEAAAQVRRERDSRVLACAPPGAPPTDLRNPAQVRALLAAAGVRVETTRKWVLEPYRHAHPLVDALLRWRADERIATTYGYRWLDENVGPDDRLRGTWTACDGAAGRMTAQNGLHNLPAMLRPAVAAHPGFVLVRADLGQIEPRVLAVVSGDRALAAATQDDDLYQPVAARLGVDRPVAKVAMLAAMYGQRSGAAGQTLAAMERAFPVATQFLDRAYATGVGRGELRTFGGRLIRLDGPGSPDVGAAASAMAAARGRYARNAVIQGSAAELFKAWAATVRHAVSPWGAQVVLCLHDELLIHTPTDQSARTAAALVEALAQSSRRWAGTDEVRFVADVDVVQRWSDAK